MKNYLLAILIALVLSSLINGIGAPPPQPVPIGVTGVQEGTESPNRGDEAIADFGYTDENRVSGMVTKVSEKGDRQVDFPAGINF